MQEKLINIEAERGRLMLSKIQFCKILGVTTQTYNSYLNGETSIPSSVLIKLREVTGKTIDYLLGLVDDDDA